MTKFLKSLYCVLFFAVILAPLALISLDNGELAENRPPAPAPELMVDGRLNLEAPTQAEEFFRDRFAGRALMIDAYSHLVGRVFGVSANDKVIMGRDGWLFFTETVGDFDGTAALSDAQMGQLTEYLLGLKRAAEARGQAFIILVAPNKNTLYFDNMPRGYMRTDAPTNLERLLEADELECIDIGAAFRHYMETTGQDVYLKTDSHWNGIGASIAAREIMSTIEDKTGVGADFEWVGIAFDRKTATDFGPVADFTNYGDVGAAGPFFDTQSITGDLAGMLYPLSPPSETDIVYSYAGERRYATVGRFRSFDDLHITTRSDGAPLSVAMYRDSFAISLIPFLSNAYSGVFYTRQTPPPMGRSEFLEADVIIFEIAERRLPELLG